MSEVIDKIWYPSYPGKSLQNPPLIAKMITNICSVVVLADVGVGLFDHNFSPGGGVLRPTDDSSGSAGDT
jgi:hypothetical protein